MIIPDNILRQGYNGLVHVEGWSRGAAFRFLGFRGIMKILRTPKTGRYYYTTNNLLYTKRNMPCIAARS